MAEPEGEPSPDNKYIKLPDKPIGEGAFKRVYRAYDTVNGSYVAWNSINLSQLTPADRERAEREIDTLNSIKNEHILNCLASWKDSSKNRLVFITDIFESGDLRKFVESHQVKLIHIKRWCTQILKGLNYLHSLNPPIVHRDLKCENVLYLPKNKGHLILGDLGIAIQRPSEGKSVAGGGTPNYMAPEALEDKCDTKLDIYAFGMCVLEMATRKTPYEECSNELEIYKRILEGRAPNALHSISIPSLQDFIQQCIQRHPEDRPTAAELLESPFLTEQSDDDDRDDLVVQGQEERKTAESPNSEDEEEEESDEEGGQEIITLGGEDDDEVEMHSEEVGDADVSERKGTDLTAAGLGGGYWSGKGEDARPRGFSADVGTLGVDALPQPTDQVDEVKGDKSGEGGTRGSSGFMFRGRTQSSGSLGHQLGGSGISAFSGSLGVSNASEAPNAPHDGEERDEQWAKLIESGSEAVSDHEDEGPGSPRLRPRAAAFEEKKMKKAAAADAEGKGNVTADEDGTDGQDGGDEGITTEVDDDNDDDDDDEGEEDGADMMSAVSGQVTSSHEDGDSSGEEDDMDSVTSADGSEVDSDIASGVADPIGVDADSDSGNDGDDNMADDSDDDDDGDDDKRTTNDGQGSMKTPNDAEGQASRPSASHTDYSENEDRDSVSYRQSRTSSLDLPTDTPLGEYSSADNQSPLLAPMSARTFTGPRLRAGTSSNPEEHDSGSNTTDAERQKRWHERVRKLGGGKQKKKGKAQPSPTKKGKRKQKKAERTPSRNRSRLRVQAKDTTPLSGEADEQGSALGSPTYGGQQRRLTFAAAQDSPLLASPSYQDSETDAIKLDFLPDWRGEIHLAAQGRLGDGSSYQWGFNYHCGLDNPYAVAHDLIQALSSDWSPNQPLRHFLSRMVGEYFAYIQDACLRIQDYQLGISGTSDTHSDPGPPGTEGSDAIPLGSPASVRDLLVPPIEPPTKPSSLTAADSEGSSSLAMEPVVFVLHHLKLQYSDFRLCIRIRNLVSGFQSSTSPPSERLTRKSSIRSRKYHQAHFPSARSQASLGSTTMAPPLPRRRVSYLGRRASDSTKQDAGVQCLPLSPPRHARAISDATWLLRRRKPSPLNRTFFIDAVRSPEPLEKATGITTAAAAGVAPAPAPAPPHQKTSQLSLTEQQKSPVETTRQVVEQPQREPETATKPKPLPPAEPHSAALPASSASAAQPKTLREDASPSTPPKPERAMVSAQTPSSSSPQPRRKVQALRTSQSARDVSKLGSPGSPGTSRSLKSDTHQAVAAQKKAFFNDPQRPKQVRRTLMSPAQSPGRPTVREVGGLASRRQPESKRAPSLAIANPSPEPPVMVASGRKNVAPTFVEDLKIAEGLPSSVRGQSTSPMSKDPSPRLDKHSLRSRSSHNLMETIQTARRTHEARKLTKGEAIKAETSKLDAPGQAREEPSPRNAAGVMKHPAVPRFPDDPFAMAANPVTPVAATPGPGLQGIWGGTSTASLGSASSVGTPTHDLDPFAGPPASGRSAVSSVAGAAMPRMGYGPGLPLPGFSGMGGPTHGLAPYAAFPNPDVRNVPMPAHSVAGNAFPPAPPVPAGGLGALGFGPGSAETGNRNAPARFNALNPS